MITDRELRLLRVVRRLAADRPRIGPGRVHKAGSAEAILRHCLKARGWTKLYRRGELTGEQHLELLHDVRNYGRAWLRHEAEMFVRHYLSGDVHADGARSARGGVADRDFAERLQQAGGVQRSDEDVRRPHGRGTLAVSRALGKGIASHFSRFFGRAKQFVRELIVAGMAALTGPAPLTGEELEGAEKEAVRQDRFFDEFYDELKFWGKPAPKPLPPQPGILVPAPVVKPPMTPPQFVARVESYADSVHHAAQNANRATAIRQGVFKVERLIMGVPKTEHCDECPADAAKGWVPIGTLKPIGARQCENHCLCHYQYATAPGARPHIQGNKGTLPAPAGVTLEPDDDGVYPVAEPPGQTIKAPTAGPPK